MYFTQLPRHALHLKASPNDARSARESILQTLAGNW